ncbi:alkaline-phosphatase-like protein [Mycena rebaudengoi]|nr:alkaline-phosphatase-like protein [Mycena rebaudengoi]
MKPLTFLLTMVVAASAQAATAKTGPNIVFILTDDQDLLLDSLDYMPNVKELLTDKGAYYRRHYCTVSLCCPSRVSLLTGKAAHNTNVTSVQPPYGGYQKFVQEGLNSDYLPIWLQKAGYNTYYTGKLMNGHTIENYKAPFVQGFTKSSFLLDPGMYNYLNSIWQTGTDAPQIFPKQHIQDLTNERAYALLDDAVQQDVPFFLTIAPVAPHAQFIDNLTNPPLFTDISPPIPQEKFKNLFADAKVPRTPNFNPDVPSGGSWIKDLPELDEATLTYNDAFYVKRLQALTGVDEMVKGVVERLAASGILSSTYIVYTTDNGYHIGQHRLQPGKMCPVEEDHNIPLIIHGPGVPAGAVVESVTTHTDLAPTFLRLLGVDLRDDFDGVPIPVSAREIAEARRDVAKSEQVNMEFWGLIVARNEGNSGSFAPQNQTYKAIRVVGASYSLAYTVWCDNDHELYDLTTDPYQMNNLLGAARATDVSRRPITVDIPQLVARLDALMMVLKSCKAQACRDPWRVIHPQGNVHNLNDAMTRKYDAFYEAQPRVSFSMCGPGYLVAVEGEQSVIPFS